MAAVLKNTFLTTIAKRNGGISPSPAISDRDYGKDRILQLDKAYAEHSEIVTARFHPRAPEVNLYRNE
jgi:hypothetical protein